MYKLILNTDRIYTTNENLMDAPLFPTFSRLLLGNSIEGSLEGCDEG